MQDLGRGLWSQDLALIPYVTPLTLGLGVLLFSYFLLKFWGETDRILPKN